MTKNLISDSRFGAFFWTQFLGAFNDNLLKFAVTLAIAYNDTLRGDYSAGLLVNLVAGLFILPFFLVSATSGQLADKHDKTRVMRVAKLLEPPIVILTTLGFVLNSVLVLIFALFLLGVQSAFFGPAKYAYLPEHMKQSELVLANAMVETATFVAILLGTISAGALMGQDDTNTMVYVVCAFALLVSLVGVYFSRRMPLTPSHQPDLLVNWNVFTETWRNVVFVKQLKAVWPALLGISWLWFVGATYLTEFPVLTTTLLNASARVATFLLFLFTVGLGVGAFVCERFSKKRIEMGMVPWGLLIMTVGGVMLHILFINQQGPDGVVEMAEFLASTQNIKLCGLFFMISFGVGLYSVPLYASMQAYAPKESRSRVVSGNNIVNSLFMVTSAAVAIVVLVVANGKVIWVFSTLTLINALILVLWCKRNPSLLLRAWLLLRVKGSTVPLIESDGYVIPTGGQLIVFPTLLHEDYRAKILAMPIPFSVVLSGRLKSSKLVNWMRKKEFVFEFSKLEEDESQRALIQRIAAEIIKRNSIAIDKPMFELLKRKYKLNDLPNILIKKNVTMNILEFVDEKVEVSGVKRRALRLNQSAVSPY